MPDQPKDTLYSELATKWLNGTITTEEEDIFADWYNENQDNNIHIPLSVAGNEQELAAKIFAGIQHRKQARVMPFYRRYFPHIAAAFILVMVGSAAYYMMNKAPVQNLSSFNEIQPHNDVLLPGDSRAVLKLSDGSTIVLDSSSNGNIASQGNTKIIKLNNGKLAYEAGDSRNELPAFNTLTTPKGGQYQITLKDGTNVWLNAGSSLTFPTDFSGHDRIVELQGEAYFEVAENKSKSFKVKTKNMEVVVLGTQFNVMAYQDEAAIKTTLLQGSVKVNYADKAALLKPSQQSQLAHNGTIKVINNIDVNAEIAWKNGMFHFEETDIESVMRQLSRWYNLDIEYEGKISKHFSGKILRSVEASKVFQMLELTGEVHFRISGRKVIVSP